MSSKGARPAAQKAGRRADRVIVPVTTIVYYFQQISRHLDWLEERIQETQ